jgi:hypothetical protein
LTAISNGSCPRGSRLSDVASPRVYVLRLRQVPSPPMPGGSVRREERTRSLERGLHSLREPRRLRAGAAFVAKGPAPISRKGVERRTRRRLTRSSPGAQSRIHDDGHPAHAACSLTGRSKTAQETDESTTADDSTTTRKEETPLSCLRAFVGCRVPCLCVFLRRRCFAALLHVSALRFATTAARQGGARAPDPAQRQRVRKEIKLAVDMDWAVIRIRSPRVTPIAAS